MDGICTKSKKTTYLMTSRFRCSTCLYGVRKRVTSILRRWIWDESDESNTITNNFQRLQFSYKQKEELFHKNPAHSRCNQETGWMNAKVHECSIMSRSLICSHMKSMNTGEKAFELGICVASHLQQSAHGIAILLSRKCHTQQLSKKEESLC